MGELLPFTETDDTPELLYDSMELVEPVVEGETLIAPD